MYWFILNGLFLFDATITLLRRIYKREKWFAAHRKHAYQRLKQYGFNTRLIILGQTCVNITLFAGVLLMQQKTILQNVIFVFCLSILIVIYSLIEKLYPMFKE